MTQIVRLSKLLGQRLLDAGGEPVGAVVDLVARFADEGYPPVTGALVKAAGSELFAPSHRLGLIDEESVRLNPGIEVGRLNAFERRPGEVLLRRDVLGHPLIHLGEHHHARLVRAADVDVAQVAGAWRVVGIDASRRRWSWRHKDGDGHQCFVDWARLEPFVGHVPTARLRLRLRRLAQLHPGEIADLVEEASKAESAEIIAAIGQDRELEADVFEELDQDHQLELVSKRTDAEVARLLASMAPDDAADLLTEIDQERREPILAAMAPAQEQRLRSLLRYHPETAGGMMTPMAVCFSPGDTVGAALRRIGSGADIPETIDTVFVCAPDGRLVAAMRLAEMLRVPPDAVLGVAARADPPRVSTGADLSDVALTMTDFNLATLPVVDDDERVVGVVTVDDLLELLVPEAWRRRAEAAGE